MSLKSYIEDLFKGDQPQTNEIFDLFEFVSGASFKEIPFLLDSSDITGGRKDVLHEYVNSDNQSIEDLGLKRRSYNIKAIVHGDNYFLDRDNLLSALEEGTSGTLVHPFYGALENMKARTFRVVENFNDFGIAIFDITFDYDSPSGAAPFQESNTYSEVAAAASKAKNDLEKSLSDSIKTPKTKSGFDRLKDKLSGFTNSISNAAKVSGGIVSEINSFNDQISAFSGALVDLISIPQKLASSVKDLFITMGNCFDSPLGALESMIDMFNFGDDDKPKLNVNTVNNNTIVNNNDSLNVSIKTFALIEAYDYLTKSDFSTVEELEYYESKVEKQFQIVINSISQTSVQSKSSLLSLRTVSSKVIDQTKVKLPNSITIDVGVETPLRVLEYQYYGNNDQTDGIRKLNSIPDESFYIGQVDIINNANN